MRRFNPEADTVRMDEILLVGGPVDGFGLPKEAVKDGPGGQTYIVLLPRLGTGFCRAVWEPTDFIDDEGRTIYEFQGIDIQAK